VEVCGVDGDLLLMVVGGFLGEGEGEGEGGGVLGLDLAGALDEGADEGFGVAVYGCDYGGGDGLGEGLVCDLGSSGRSGWLGMDGWWGKGMDEGKWGWRGKEGAGGGGIVPCGLFLSSA